MFKNKGCFRAYRWHKIVINFSIYKGGYYANKWGFKAIIY